MKTIQPNFIPPGAFLPIYGSGEVIFTLVSSYPNQEIIGIPETLKLDTQDDLRRSFRQICRISSAFRKPFEMERAITEIKNLTVDIDEFEDNKIRIQEEWDRYFDTVTGFLPDISRRTIIGMHITSPMQITIAENICGILDTFGAHEPETSLYKIFARWAFAFGRNKMFLDNNQKKDTPPSLSSLPSSVTRPRHDVKAFTHVFDPNKKQDRSMTRLNRCRFLGCDVTTGYLPNCEYHTHMLVDLASKDLLACAAPSLQDPNIQTYARDRINRCSS